MLKAFEIRQQRAGVVAEARKIADKAADEKRSLSAEEQTKFDELMIRSDSLLADAKRIEKMEAIEEEIRSAGPGRELNADLPHAKEKRHTYSVLRALRQSLASREGKGKLDGLEGETHQELLKHRGDRETRGVLIPYSVAADVRSEGLTATEKRDLTTSTGVGSIPTILDHTLIDILRAQMVTREAGATVLEGMQGLFALPRQSGTGTTFWVAEGNGITSSNQTIDQVPFNPKTVGALTNYSRRFVEQTNQNAEQFARNDLMAIVARGLETAGLNGQGVASNQPTGILQNSTIATNSIPLSSGTNGGPLTWNNLILMEQLVAVANADIGKLAYITDKAVRGHMKRTPKVNSSTFPLYLWDGGPTPVNEYACPTTNLLPTNLTKGSATNCHAMIFGNWADLIYALWSGMDVVVDPYTGAAAGAVRIVILQDADINVRHPESFITLTDIIPS